jgi:murein DD-endopeptidase MepM/ murein hydrolase activator NlpD
MFSVPSSMNTERARIGSPLIEGRPYASGNTGTYGHLSKISVKVGQTVNRGQFLGKSGNTGKSTAPHVHYGEQHKGNPHRPTFNPGGYKPRKPKSDTRRH